MYDLASQVREGNIAPSVRKQTKPRARLYLGSSNFVETRSGCEGINVAGGASPVKNAWKKKHRRPQRGSNMFLGEIQYFGRHSRSMP